MRMLQIAILTLLCACQVGSGVPQASVLPVKSPLTPGSKGENLTPSSKGENLTPGSKGEHKLSEIQGEVYLPLALDGPPEQMRIFIDGQRISAKHIQLEMISETQLSYSLKEIETGTNLVLDIEAGPMQLSRMIPELGESLLKAQDIDLHSTAVVVIARRAEDQGIRKLKDWQIDELTQLINLPELGQLSEAYASAYPGQIDAAEKAEIDRLTGELLARFLEQLNSEE